jgi:hypothetical protein
MQWKIIIAGSVLTVGLLGPSFVTGVSAAAVDDVGQKRVVLSNTSVQDGSVSGEIVNNLQHEVQEVQLLVRHVWHWNNEFRPGTDDPGNATYFTVNRAIPPGGKVPFSFKSTGPLSGRPDGRFETMISVAGYTEMIRQR